MAVATSINASKWMVGVMAAVVLAFLAATFTAQYLESAIAERANDIIGNAMPSVRLLSEARGDLHQLESAVVSDNTDQVASARQDIEQLLATYHALPFFPDERDVFSHVTAALAQLDRDLAHSPSDHALLRSDIERVDDTLQRSVEFDAAQGERLGIEIEHVRGQTKGTVALLDGVAVALALAAVVLALRQLRRVMAARAEEEAARKRHDDELGAQVEALGEFSARVAHDVLSPLAATMFALEIVRQSCHEDHTALRATAKAAAAVLRVRTLVDGLLAFARSGGQPEPGITAEVAPVLSDALDVVAVPAREHSVALDLAPVPAGSVACSPGVLTSIVTNLVGNAIKYMGDARERRVSVRASVEAGRWHVEVTDTGPGVPEAQQRRIFEPYFQIKRAGGGIGLGLATVDRLVRAHGGSVGLRSQLGTGTTFWFELPAA